MKDPLFGNLSWAGGYWEGAVSIPYFRGFGSGMPAVSQSPAEPPDPFGDDEDDDPTPSEGKLDLHVTPGGGTRQKPTDAQRLAWQMILDRRDAVWEELMGRVLDEYRRQRPVRVRWWKSVFGEHALSRFLPELKDPRALSRTIHPANVLVQPHVVAPAATPDVLVQFVGSWLAGGFAVVLRDGRVADLSRYAAPDRDETPVRFDHPAFGRLSWNDHYAAWLGVVRWNEVGRSDGLETFAKAAPMRAHFESRPAYFKNPDLPLEWDFINGRFTTLVHVVDVEAPTARQSAACESFRAGAARHAADIADAIFAHLQASGAASKVRSADAVRECLELSTVHVFPVDAKDPPGPALGFTFDGPDDTSVGVRIRDGRVEAVGDAGVAEPPPRQRGKKRPAVPTTEGPPSPPKTPSQPATKPAPKPKKGRVGYRLEFAKDGDGVGIDFDVHSDRLDPALHPGGTLRVVVFEDTASPRMKTIPALRAGEDTTMFHYLRKQKLIRARLEEALAADQERRSPDGEAVRGDVWSWARLIRLEFNPPDRRRRNAPGIAFTLYFDCDWEEEHQVVVAFEGDQVKSVGIE
jgi:hypothetical protein